MLMRTDDLRQTLLDIDEEVYLLHGVIQPKPCVVIVGGAAFLLRDLTSRVTTYDIDVLQADDVVRKVLAGYSNVNGSVAAYADQVPYNFEDRLVELDMQTRTIDFKVPSTEDLVVMKLYAQRPNDMQDIESAAAGKKLDWGLLEHLVYDPDEAAASVLSLRRYGEMTDAFERFKERCKKK